MMAPTKSRSCYSEVRQFLYHQPHTASASNAGYRGDSGASLELDGAFNIGGQVGAATGTANFADPFGASVFGDRVTTPAFARRRPARLQLAGAELEVGVRGLQTDANWLASDGTNTCFAFKMDSSRSRRRAMRIPMPSAR